MFTDLVKLKLRAGKGGNGVVAWCREKFIPKGGPSGGNGGPGGCVYLESDPNIFSLDAFRNKSLLAAENGGAVGSNRKNGRRGQDLVVKIPCGTILKNSVTQEIIHDFGSEAEKVLVCQGGRGGIGNEFFKTPVNQAPNKCTPGKLGDEISIELELKLIADVGFVGFPNAGKSTLLNTLSCTKVKTANYPFTTLQPNLSYIQFEDYSRIYVADIPGIIEDAHKNKGLGLAFLKHIERTSVLVYVIDISQEERGSAFDDFLTLQNELRSYNKELLEKPFVVALNKIDEENAEEGINAFIKNYPYEKETLYQISSMTGEGIEPFKKAIQTLAQKDGKKFR
jgi:GTP-binding protein